MDFNQPKRLQSGLDKVSSRNFLKHISVLSNPRPQPQEYIFFLNIHLPRNAGLTQRDKKNLNFFRVKPQKSNPKKDRFSNNIKSKKLCF